MKKYLAAITAAGAIVALGFAPAMATGISAKLKAKKVQGDLVPAFACDAFDTDPGCRQSSPRIRTCSNDHSINCSADGDCGVGNQCVGNVTQTSLGGRDCTFEQAKFKMMVGKAAQVQVKTLSCDPGYGVPPNLCTHVRAYSTIMDEDIDKNGVSTPRSCTPSSPPPGNPSIAGESTSAIGQVGQIDCTTSGSGKTTCKGEVDVGIGGGDPCPDADKVSALQDFEVFDGPDLVSVNVLGSNLTGCCGPNEQIVPGGALTGTYHWNPCRVCQGDPSKNCEEATEVADCGADAPCIVGPQRVLAVPGTITVGCGGLGQPAC